MPFAGYKDFADCVNKNKDKENPEAYCGKIQGQIEGAEQDNHDLLSPKAQPQNIIDNDLESSKGSVMEKDSEEGLNDSEIPEKGFDLTKTENVSISGPPADSFMKGGSKREEPVILKHTESILLKRGSEYRWTPVYTESIFNYKKTAKENTGNCEFCEGTGKVTVEHLGLKECPRCDGTGDMGQVAPQMDQQGIDPNQTGQGFNLNPSDGGTMDIEIPQGNQPQQTNPQEQIQSQQPQKLGQQIPQKTSPREQLQPEEEKPKKIGESLKCPNMKAYERFVSKKINVLKNFASESETVGLMFSLPAHEGKKIKGTLAYAGASLNDRVYLPEELEKGDGKTLPLLLNHSSTAGAEEEMHRLADEVQEALEGGKDYQVGEVKLSWDPDKLTLSYEGVIDNEFFAKEVDDMDMAVSLGIYYDSDSPQYCSRESDGKCYTMIEGAEFREVSLVYHPGFPIATIEAIENIVKGKAVEAQVKEKKRRATEAKKITFEKDMKEEDDKLIEFEGKIYEKKSETELEYEGETYILKCDASEFDGGAKGKLAIPKELKKDLPKETTVKADQPEDTKLEDLIRKK